MTGRLSLHFTLIGSVRPPETEESTGSVHPAPSLQQYRGGNWDQRGPGAITTMTGTPWGHGGGRPPVPLYHAPTHALAETSTDHRAGLPVLPALLDSGSPGASQATWAGNGRCSSISSISRPNRPTLGEASYPADEPTAEAFPSLRRGPGPSTRVAPSGQGHWWPESRAADRPPPGGVLCPSQGLVLGSKWGNTLKHGPSIQTPQNKCLKLCIYLYIFKLTSKFLIVSLILVEDVISNIL